MNKGYTENQGFDDSLKRTGALLIPFLMALALPLLYSIFYIFRALSLMPKEGLTTTQALLRHVAPGAALALLAVVSCALALGAVARNAGTFLRDFYRLPDSVNERKLAGLRIFGRTPTPPPLSKIIKFPLLKIKDGKIESDPYHQAAVGGPAKLQIDAGNAVYIERGVQSARVAGQGSAFLECYETIRAVVNLGPQSRTFTLSAWTRDGIRVDLQAKGEYFLGARERTRHNENVLIPFDAETVKKAVEETLRGGKEGHEWMEVAVGKTKGAISAYISERELEEIFAGDGRLFSKQTIASLLEKINDGLRNFGAHLSFFQILNAETHEAIAAQRLKRLEVENKGYMTVALGEDKARHIRERQRGHAEMQRDLIHTLANGLERIDAANAKIMLEQVYQLLDREINHPWYEEDGYYRKQAVFEKGEAP